MLVPWSAELPANFLDLIHRGYPLTTSSRLELGERYQFLRQPIMRDDSVQDQYIGTSFQLVEPPL